MTSPIVDTVRRALRRDVMLQLAHDAEQLMIVVRNQDRQAAVAGSGTDLFQLAVDRYLGQADVERDDRTADLNWSFRSKGNDHAATILLFCAYMGIPLKRGRNIEALYRAAIAELRPGGPGPALDRLAEVTVTHRLVRGLRATGRLDEALRLATSLDQRFVYGSGAEPTIAEIHFEIGSSLLEKGHPEQARAALGELEKTYWQATTASVFSTRHRYDYIMGMAELAAGQITAALDRLEAGREHLTSHRIADTRHDVYELSLTLALAEALAAGGRDPERATTLAEQSLEQAERIRGRWGVIARTKTPLALAFRRVCGDQALLAASLPGLRAARLGLRVCLSSKQTGFASHMRAGELLLAGPLRGLVTDVLSAEHLQFQDLAANADDLAAQRAKQDERLESLRRRIEKAVTPMLADSILPTPKEITEIIDVLAGRHAFDATRLEDTLNSGVNWFRSHIEPSGYLHFERFEPGPHLAAYFDPTPDQAPWLDRLLEATKDDHPDWLGLATEVLPYGLLRRLRAATDDAPIELVISPHERLGLLPWPALAIDDAGTRLVERAVLTQTPVLTCLSTRRPPAVSGPALVRLVNESEGGVWIEREREAWGISLVDGRSALSICTWDGDPARPAREDRLSAALAAGAEPCGFLHVAAHGDGSGLGQFLHLPEETATEGQLSAAQALVLRWPDSTLMASCRVGRLVNVEDEEPLSFVTAILTAGGRCVVAAIDDVLDVPAGRMAGRLIDLLRSERGRLDHALRRAQLEEHRRGRLENWALFNAYVR